MEDSPLPRLPRGMRPLIGPLDPYGQMPLVGPLLTVGRALGPGLLDIGLSIAPGSGEVMSARDSVEAGRRMSEAIRAGDYGGAISHGAESVAAAMGALPFIGLAVRSGRAAGSVVPFTRTPVRPIPEQQIGARSGVPAVAPRGEVAANLGFDARPYYYATTRDVRGFGPWSYFYDRWPMSPAREGYLLAGTPEEALRLAGIRADTEGANILRLYARTSRQGTIDPQGVPLRGHELAGELRDLRASGLYDTARILAAQPGGAELLAVFDPRDIRSVHAAFNPQRSDPGPRVRDEPPLRFPIRSRNILAGIGTGGLLTLGWPGDEAEVSR